MGLIIKGPPSQGYQHFPYDTLNPYQPGRVRRPRMPFGGPS